MTVLVTFYCSCFVKYCNLPEKFVEQKDKNQVKKKECSINSLIKFFFTKEEFNAFVIDCLYRMLDLSY